MQGKCKNAVARLDRDRRSRHAARRLSRVHRLAIDQRAATREAQRRRRGSVASNQSHVAFWCILTYGSATMGNSLKSLWRSLNFDIRVFAAFFLLFLSAMPKRCICDGQRGDLLEDLVQVLPHLWAEKLNSHDFIMDCHSSLEEIEHGAHVISAPLRPCDSDSKTTNGEGEKRL